MTLKKFYGLSIDEAREKVQDALGQTYTVVEMKEAINDEPAWIHVLDDGDNPVKNNNAATYSRRDLFPKALTKLKETVNDSLQLFNTGHPEAYTPGYETTTPKNVVPSQANAPKHSTGRTNKSNPSFSIEEPTLLEKELEKLNKRFDRLEKIVSKQMFGARIQIVSHPAFQQLLANGVPYTTVSRWFNEIVEQGIDSYRRQERFMPLLAQKVTQALDIAAENELAPYVLFTGVPGCGKSSLMMKLVLNTKLLGSRTCALVSVHPAGTNHFYSPLASFAAEYDVSHYDLKKNQQLSEWKEEWSDFDHILIEIPATELQSTPGRFSADTFGKLLPSGESPEVHHVINTTLNPACLERQPILNDRFPINYIDFTHLDGASQKGHLLPLMKEWECKVRYVTSGPEIPGDIAKFEPSRFARQLLTNI